MVESLPATASQVTWRRSVPQPFFQVILVFEAQGILCIKGKYCRLVSEIDAACLVRAVRLNLVQHVVDALNPELSADVVRIQFAIHASVSIFFAVKKELACAGEQVWALRLSADYRVVAQRGVECGKGPSAADLAFARG
jgi:hypothetical protein